MFPSPLSCSYQNVYTLMMMMITIVVMMVMCFVQEEVEQVRRSLLEVGDRCEAAIVKYELYKIKSKGKIHALKLVWHYCSLC